MTGEVSVDPAMAEDLLTAADQYMLENLKRGCEEVLAQQICLDNLYQLYTISRDMHASFLGTQCVLYALQHYDDLSKVSVTNALVSHKKDSSSKGALAQNRHEVFTEGFKSEKM